MDAWDAYFWPDAIVLKNKLGLVNEAALSSFEYEATRQRSEQLAHDPLPGIFDTAHFRAIHRFLFQDVYDWAGQYRTVEISKGRSTFAPLKTPMHTLESWGEAILKNLAKENHLKGLKTKRFVDRLTHHYGELNFWHPMREGNGRATKEFLYQLGKDAGYDLQFERSSANAWNEAAKRQNDGDSKLARELFEKITVPSRAIAFRDEHVVDAVKRHPELQGAVDALYQAKLKAEAEMTIADQRVFIAQVHTKLLERLHEGEIIGASFPSRAPKITPEDPGRDDR